MLIDSFRVTLHDVLHSTRADGVKPVKLLREMLTTANDLVGRPLCSRDELAERRAEATAASPVTLVREPAPVMLYFDGKDHRTKKKLEEVLKSRDIPFQVLDVTDDE